ncbi:MAG: hypothetical protein ACYDBJ_10855 [Aggregatilineales bacterium]
MTILELTGQINEKGELEANLPEGLPVGEVQITIELPDEAPLTDEEVAELLRPPERYPTGAEIVAAMKSRELDTSAWADVGDGMAWVETQRKKRRERRRW